MPTKPGKLHEVSSILRRAIAGGCQAFLPVNHKAEGSSPLTIEAIAGRLAAEVARVHA